jgi:hypothetical protein
MQTTTKCGHVSFSHSDEYTGEVQIAKGDHTVTVPMEALCKLIAEKMRFELIQQVQKMKPETLLKRLA